jgi:dTDP-4-dehydrorhamnose reductase
MILITGANGQLGREFQKLFQRLGLAYTPTHRTAQDGCRALDITDGAAVRQAVASGPPPTYIINCAAYNAVDRAESEPERALAVNRDAVAHLAEAARRAKAVFVTFSTDYVFDGRLRRPYVEEDAANPLNRYGQSKLLGERAALETWEKSFVIRTSWVYGANGAGNANFSRSLLRWARERDELRMADDQVSVPTYAADLAAFAWALAQSEAYGTYHLTNGGEASKYDQARRLLGLIGWRGKLIRAKAADFPSPAARPAYSKLDSAKAERVLGRSMPSWEEALERFVREMKEAGEL